MKDCNMKRNVLPLLVFLSLFLTGCISAERMLRNSPFHHDLNNDRFCRDSINLFPLYYQNG